MPSLGYVRTSTNRQDLSIEAQTERVRRAAEYHKTGELRVFSAADTSGRLEFLKRRDETAELLATAREARARGVEVTLIVPKVDRLGRDSIDVNQTVRLFDELGVRIIFLDINVDTRTAMGRAFMQIAAVFAELEVATIRERIKTALDTKRSHGYPELRDAAMQRLEQLGHGRHSDCCAPPLTGRNSQKVKFATVQI